MLCQFERPVYPKDITGLDADSYMVMLYRPCEKLVDSSGNVVTQVKAVGYGLPVSKNLRYEMRGRWSKNGKHGVQFEVDSYEEVIVPTKEGIIAYLSSGQIKGIGIKMAERIFAAFGMESLEVLDREPERLLSIPRISKGKLEKICESYMANRNARDVVAFLAPYGITPKRAVGLYKIYKERTMDVVKNHPYQLCVAAGVGFKTADSIAMRMGLDRMSPERVDEGMLYTLAEAEGKGNLCMEKHAFVKVCLNILDTPGLTEEMVAGRAVRLLGSGQLASYQGNVYRGKTAEAEERLAWSVHELLAAQKIPRYGNLDHELDAAEGKLKVKFAPAQRKAIKMALTNGMSIITGGGPGTGKTMIQHALLNIYRRNNPKNRICCCAPTGRAARKMEQATGFTATTVHKALGLVSGEDGAHGDSEILHADLVLVDEVSMLDIYLAGCLFHAAGAGTQIVLVGDADQLPSVGPGAVLSELIASGRIPVARLDQVFRQDTGSLIAANAKRIRHGCSSLEYGDDFQFIDSPVISDSAGLIASLYMEEIRKHGVDNVALLSPYRQKTETGVNALNQMLREMVNPDGNGKAEVLCGRRKFRTGDKVMQVKNLDDVSNGDVGYIKKIRHEGNDTAVFVDFGEGRVKRYDSSELDVLDLGYASTIHKSQGSEYQSVIINLQCAHFVMLTRPLVYTAITRGKSRVIIVGERKALHIAIGKTDTEKRGTCLAGRLRDLG